MDRCRDCGDVIFIDLQDRTGTVQGTVDSEGSPQMFHQAEHLRNETVLRLSGHGRLRPEGSVNPKLATPARWRWWPRL